MFQNQLDDHRYGHVAVTWKDATLIWGGRYRKEFFDPSLVSCHLYGKWIQKRTTGDVPSHSVFALVSVIDDRLFAIGGYDKYVRSDYSIIYSLDLNTWVWTRLISEGTPPPNNHMSHRSVVYKGNIFIFGCFYSTNGENRSRMFHYNITTNQWGHKCTIGDIPTRRRGHTTILSGDTVFLFGGNVENQGLNDLYIFDMVGLRWKLVHGPLSGDAFIDVVPKGRFAHTMTCINQSAAVVHGGVDSHWKMLGECWVLDLNKAKQLHEPSSIWTLQSKSWSKRACHAAVLEPISRRLWLTNGIHLHSSAIQKMTVNVVPLKILAMEIVVGVCGEDDPRLGQDKCPKRLKEEIEAHRNGI